MEFYVTYEVKYRRNMSEKRKCGVKLEEITWWPKTE